eukprot:Ihof_evm2s180 gene=Ihof_evmTU2s180
MRVVFEPTAADVATYSAEYIKYRINTFAPTADRYFVLGLPTGSTPLGTYKKLIEFYKKGELSFKYVKTFNMDEYCGISQDHPQSYYTFMWTNFFSHIDILPENTNILNGNAPDLAAECAAYEEKIKAAGGIELFMG